MERRERGRPRHTRSPQGLKAASLLALGGAGEAARATHESVQKLLNQADVAVKTLANVS